MSSCSEPLNSSIELSESELEENPSLFHQPVPSGSLVCAVWEGSPTQDPSVEGEFLATSVGPADPPQEVSSLYFCLLSEIDL